MNIKLLDIYCVKISVRKEVNGMAVLAKPQNELFVVREDKWEDFLNVKRNESAFKILMDRAEIFTKHLNDK